MQSGAFGLCNRMLEDMSAQETRTPGTLFRYTLLFPAAAMSRGEWRERRCDVIVNQRLSIH